MDRPIVVLDTETATVAGAPHLLEIGAVRVVDGEALDRFESLVRPQVPVEAAATAIHGIVDDDVRGAPDAQEVLARFAAWVGSDAMAAHSARFDAGVIGFECVRWGMAEDAWPAGPILDTLKLARKCLPDAPDHKLETLCQVLDIEVEVRHRALPDAVSCWKVLEACAERMSEAEPARAIGWVELAARAGKTVTIAAAAPRAPRLSQRLRGLQEARDAGSRVAIVYGETGGLARLVVAPRVLFDTRRGGYMEAECARSGLLKTYRLDRVRKVEACA